MKPAPTLLMVEIDDFTISWAIFVRGICGLLLMSHVVCVAGQVPADAAESTPEMEMENDYDIVRDPFWPVGYIPPALIPEDEKVEEKPKIEDSMWEAAQEKVVISGVSDMGQAGFFAIVNGVMHQQDEVIAVEHEGKSFRWRIKSIDKNGVRLQPLEVDENSSEDAE